MERKRVIFLVDMESFYASVEVAMNPNYENKPLVVSGDPDRRSGVILAASPLAKSKGIKNGERLFEAQSKCPNLIVVRPHMQTYIDVSLIISKILQQYTDLVEPYSIDEQFMDVTGSIRLFGSPMEIAKSVQKRILTQTGVRARIGIGENKILAKLACDNFAKGIKEGIYWLHKDTLEFDLWSIRIEKMFGVGSRMSKHFRNMGIRTIGQLAKSDVREIKRKFGIHGQVLWMSANGEDFSPVTKRAHDGRKGYGNGMTLPRDYKSKQELKVVLLELCEEICYRARTDGFMGTTVTLSLSGGDWSTPQGFNRQITLSRDTNITMEVYKYVCELLDKYWDGFPVRRVSVGIKNLQSDQNWQLSLFDDNENRDRLSLIGYTMDAIKNKYGKTAITRASSLLEASQFKDRNRKIGGHYK